MRDPQSFLELPYMIKQLFSDTPRFNVFTILRGNSDEVRLHSRFIAELLNPLGSHQQGSTFLKLFLDTLNIDFDMNSVVSVDKEWQDIDILIRNDANQAVIIENKVFAIDQDEQLSRYHTIIKSQRFTGINTVYLTLDGKQPSEQSIGNLELESIKCISYAEHIRDWLELCLKEVALIPALRESIQQYYEVIKSMTNQDQDEKYLARLKTFIQQDAAANNPVKMLGDLTLATQMLHAEQVKACVLKVLELVKTKTKLSSDLDIDSINDTVVKVVQGNSRLDIGFYPLKHNGLECKGLSIRVGFGPEHPYLGIACPKDEHPKVHANLVALKKDSLAYLNYSDKGLPGYRYIQSSLNIAELNDDNLRYFLDESSRNEYAQAIADDLIECISVVQASESLPSLLSETVV